MNMRFQKFIACLCVAATTILCWQSRADAQPRLVLLAPACADIVDKLDAGEYVVGVSNSIAEFPDAERLGTHINPCIECIAALKPTLIIATDKFTLDSRIKSAVYTYDPATLNDIISSVRELGTLLGKDGEPLAGELQMVLKEFKELKNRPTVLYEVRSNPLSLLGANSAAADALKTAGFDLMRKEKSTGAVSVEYIMANQPDYYIYQEGPMNKNPENPAKRKGWRLKSCVWKVDEKLFARANTNLFYEALRINKAVNSDNACVEDGK